MKFLNGVLTLGLIALAGSAQAECNTALQTDTPGDRFVTVADAFLVDRTSGLMWQRCALGFQWREGDCQADASVPTEGLTWEQALQRGVADASGEYTDWRLPNVKELETLVDRSCFTPAIAAELFPGTPVALFWTSSPNAVRPDVAKVIDFDKGAHRSLGKTSTAQVRLVRDYRPSAD